MYKVNDVIDSKYTVTGLCSDFGGMGTILHVTTVIGEPPFPLVLKYCKIDKPDTIQRFNREVRNALAFQDNAKVIQIVDHNLDHSPPYFVMQFYPDGDLTTFWPDIQTDHNLQESIFMSMVDCVQELHAQGYQHRDIKPQNFLRDKSNLVISDLGLAKEIGAGTTFTMKNEYWGSQGYTPPEFIAEGFACAKPHSDIFMLGKSFYNLATKRDPMYLTGKDIHEALFHVIDKCCLVDERQRFQTIAELKQSLSLAYDIILDRAHGDAKARQALAKILDKLSTTNKYSTDDVEDFITILDSLPKDVQEGIISELPKPFFSVIALDPVSHLLPIFFRCYEPFVRKAVGLYSYAETVANNMAVVFKHSINNAHKAKALEIGANAAIWANRFTAMDTCRSLITSVVDDGLALLISAIITQHPGSFLTSIEPAACKNEIIKKALREASNN